MTKKQRGFRQWRSIWVALTLLLIVSCRKEDGSPQVEMPADAMLPVDSVKSWFNSKYATDSVKNDAVKTQSVKGAFPGLKISWEHFTSAEGDHGAYGLVSLDGQPKVNGYALGYRKLLITQKDDGTLLAQVLEIIPDAAYLQSRGRAMRADFYGRIFFFDDRYKLVKGVTYANGKVIGEIRPVKEGGLKKQAVMSAPIVVEDCSWVDNNYINVAGEVVVYSERICNYSIIDDGLSGGGDVSGGGDYAGGGGGGGGTADGAPPVSELPGESKPRISPREYMECFANIPDAGASMTVTVYVQEPWPGTTFNIGSNSVGHTAIGLRKQNGGQSVTQVVGFYPDASGLSKAHAPSKLVDNSGLDYNVSITYNVNAKQFASIVQYISTPPKTYDIFDFNCTNFVYAALQRGGITLPDPYNTVGPSGPGGSVETMAPAGLGYTLDNLKDNRNVNNNGGTMPNGKGPCK